MYDVTPFVKLEADCLERLVGVAQRAPRVRRPSWSWLGYDCARKVRWDVAYFLHGFFKHFFIVFVL